MIKVGYHLQLPFAFGKLLQIIAHRLALGYLWYSEIATDFDIVF